MPGPSWVLSTMTLELHRFALWESTLCGLFSIVNPAGLHGPQLVELMDMEQWIQWANCTQINLQTNNGFPIFRSLVLHNHLGRGAEQG